MTQPPVKPSNTADVPGPAHLADGTDCPPGQGHFPRLPPDLTAFDCPAMRYAPCRVGFPNRTACKSFVQKYYWSWDSKFRASSDLAAGSPSAWTLISLRGTCALLRGWLVLHDHRIPGRQGRPAHSRKLEVQHISLFVLANSRTLHGTVPGIGTFREERQGGNERTGAHSPHKPPQTPCQPIT